MSNSFDVIVVGLGAMGSATCHHLAKRGLRVLGLDRFAVPHAFGSSHGFSRFIRKAYWEHPDYVPLLQRAFENWEHLERDANVKVLHKTGGIYMGRPDSEAIAGSLRSARERKLPHDTLSHAQLAKRFPQFRLPGDFIGMWEDDAGFVLPELAISAHCEQALRKGAELRGHEPAINWSASGSSVRVTTPRGTYEAGKVVFCGGAWADTLVRDMGVTLRVTRQPLFWVWPRDPAPFAFGRLPVWMIDTGWGGQHYGFPMMPDNPGFKLALHKVMEATGPDQVAREPRPSDEETVRPLLREMIPLADGPVLSIRICLYENSPDGHFIMDRHPRHENVLLACGFSGHGFKFASVVGEAMADLAQHGSTKLPIGFLGLSRLT